MVQSILRYIIYKNYLWSKVNINQTNYQSVFLDNYFDSCHSFFSNVFCRLVAPVRGTPHTQIPILKLNYKKVSYTRC